MNALKNRLLFYYTDNSGYRRYISAKNEKSIRFNGTYEFIIPEDKSIETKKKAVDYVLDFIQNMDSQFKKKDWLIEKS